MEILSSELSELIPSESDENDTIVVATDLRPSVDRSFESSMSSSSHRIERFGEILITASDEDESDELLELDELLKRKPIQLRPLPDYKDQGRARRRPLFKNSKPKYVDTSRDDEAKFNKLMEQTKKDLTKYDDYKEAAQVAMKLELDQLEATEVSTEDKRQKIITTDRIMTRVGELDSEKAEKFAQALDRTELVHGSQKWSFFETDISRFKIRHQSGSRSTISKDQDGLKSNCVTCGNRGKDFNDATLELDAIQEDSVPICRSCKRCDPSSITDNPAKTSKRKHTEVRWPELGHLPGWSIFEDAVQRELAFLGGVFEQAAIHSQLPEQLYIWILQQAFHEPRENLRQAYRLILKHGEKSISTSQAFNYILKSLKEFGVNDEAISTATPIRKVSVDPSQIARIPVSEVGLTAWLQNVGTLSGHLSGADRAKVVEWLLFLTLDSAIPLSASILLELQHTLEKCVACFDDTVTGQAVISECMTHVFHKAGDVYSRLQSLNIIPITTKVLSQMRHRLAIASFYEDPSQLEHDTTPTFLQDIKQHLDTDPQFRMTTKTDYRKVAALLACLDIAIGNGNRPEPSNTIHIKEFNTAVDGLTETIQVKFARVQANGATHISRTETKDILEAMERRLRHAIRTEPKRKRGIYDQTKLDGVYKKT